MNSLPRQPAPAAILVVDDAAENIDILKAGLRDEFIIRPALSGPLALRIAAADPTPDLILLDVMMPGMDGYEVIRHLRADEKTRDIPVIFVTAATDVENELRGLDLGATDYITKPFNPAIVKARIKTHLALREAKLKIEEQNRQLRNERALVEDILSRMRASDDFDDTHLRFLMTSVDAANGDILLSAFTPDGRQLVLVGDIAGHGVPAAVSAPLISHLFYEAAHTNQSLVEVIDVINGVMYKHLPSYLYLAACLVEISACRTQVRIGNSGMPPPIFLRHGEAPRVLEGTAVPLGIARQSNLGEACGLHLLNTQEGDRLFVYSDGIIDIPGTDGEPFGVAGMTRLLASPPSRDLPLERFMSSLDAYNGHQGFVDDITLAEICLAPRTAQPC